MQDRCIARLSAYYIIIILKGLPITRQYVAYPHKHDVPHIGVNRLKDHVSYASTIGPLAHPAGYKDASEAYLKRNSEEYNNKTNNNLILLSSFCLCKAIQIWIPLAMMTTKLNQTLLLRQKAIVGCAMLLRLA